MGRDSILQYSLLFVLFSVCCSEVPPRESQIRTEPGLNVANSTAPETSEEPKKTPQVAVMTTRYGDITIRFRADLAPETVRNFVELAENGFYYNTTFHRVMRGRMIQGGDPNSRDNNPYNDGQGTSGKLLKAEFSKEPFRRGTLAMARQPSDPDSASCQFFIVLKRMSNWDGEYTVFGEITAGLDVADKISRAKLAKLGNLKDRPAASIWIKDIRIQ